MLTPFLIRLLYDKEWISFYDCYHCFSINHRIHKEWQHCRIHFTIPLRLRYWHYLLKRKDFQYHIQNNNIQTTLAGYYQNLGLKKEMLKPTHELQGLQGEIHRDVERTFPHLQLFVAAGKGQRELFEILFALATFFPKVSYCQGMNYVAARLLQVYKCPQESFWTMASLIQTLALEDLWKPGLPALRLRVFQLQRLLSAESPHLVSHLRRIGLGVDYFATQWFMTLYARILPEESLLVVWTAFFKDGWTIMLSVALAILKRLEKDLLTLDLESASVYFRQHRQMGLETISGDELLHAAQGHIVTSSMLTSLADDYSIQIMQLRLDENGSRFSQKSSLCQEDTIPSPTSLTRMRNEINSIEACVVQDAQIFRSKIEAAVQASSTSCSLYFDAQYRMTDRMHLLHETVERKSAIQMKMQTLLLEISTEQEEAEYISPQTTPFTKRALQCFTPKTSFHSLYAKSLLQMTLEMEKATKAENVASVEYTKVQEAYKIAVVQYEECILFQKRVKEQFLQLVHENEERKTVRLVEMFHEIKEIE